MICQHIPIRTALTAVQFRNIRTLVVVQARPTWYKCDNNTQHLSHYHQMPRKNMMICDTCQHMFFQLSSNVQHLHHCPRLCTRHACTIMHPKIEAQNGTDIGTLAYSTVHPDSMFMFQHVYVETSTLVSNYLFLGSFV